VFTGSRLILNFSTSAAGSIRVELQDAAGRALEGFKLAECDEVFGDSLERTVTWREGQSDLHPHVGQTCRLRIVMKDADLFSVRFSE